MICLSLLSYANEHLATKILVFFCNASKHHVGKIPIFLHFIEFKNMCNFNHMFSTSCILRIMCSKEVKGVRS
jgi:hypothetical protein